MTVRRDVVRRNGGSHASPTRPDPSVTSTSSPVDAVPSTSKKDVTESPAEKLERVLANADWVHAYAHHRQAALYHEREAEWHRAEMKRLEGEG